MGHIHCLSMGWKILGLNLEAIGGVHVKVQEESELQAFHESLSEAPQEK